MAFKITWSPVAIESFDEIITYTKKNWSDKEVQRLVTTINRKILLLRSIPTFSIGSIKE